MGDGDNYALFARDKGNFLSGEETSDLEGEMTATITETSTSNRTCQRLYQTQRKKGGKTRSEKDSMIYREKEESQRKGEREEENGRREEKPTRG